MDTFAAFIIQYKICLRCKEFNTINDSEIYETNLRLENTFLCNRTD
jgi:hypothetical protein